MNDVTRRKFNPPPSPHFGGKWEAIVKSVNFHLKRVIGDAGLIHEEFSTLPQIEAIVNSHPCCPTDPSALAPDHFLIGAALATIICIIITAFINNVLINNDRQVKFVALHHNTQVNDLKNKP